jgi:hypothetical protein
MHLADNAMYEAKRAGGNKHRLVEKNYNHTTSK